jgi:hypothetical protein
MTLGFYAGISSKYYTFFVILLLGVPLTYNRGGLGGEPPPTLAKRKRINQSLWATSGASLT